MNAGKAYLVVEWEKVVGRSFVVEAPNAETAVDRVRNQGMGRPATKHDWDTLEHMTSWDAEQ